MITDGFEPELRPDLTDDQREVVSEVFEWEGRALVQSLDHFIEDHIAPVREGFEDAVDDDERTKATMKLVIEVTGAVAELQARLDVIGSAAAQRLQAAGITGPYQSPKNEQTAEQQLARILPGPTILNQTKGELN